MSYDIIYRSFGVQISDNQHIVIQEIGCSNLYDVENNRRSRDWCVTLNGDHAFFGTKEEHENELQKVKERYIGRKSYDEKEVCTEETFGWFSAISVRNNACSKTTWGMFAGIYLNAIKNSRTYEDLYNNYYLRLTVRIKEKVTYKTIRSQNLTPGYIVMDLEKGKEYVSKNPNTYLVIEVSSGGNYSYDSIRIDKHNKKVLKRKQKEKKQYTEAFVIVYDSTAYFSKLTSRRIFGYYTHNYAKKFKSESEAKRYINSKLENRFSCKFEVEKLTGTFQF